MFIRNFREHLLTDGVDDKPAFLHEHATERLEQLRALLARLEAEGAAEDPLLGAVRSLVADAEGKQPEAPRD